MYPVLLRLEGRHCLVVGGGRVALRKVEGLVAAGALVTIVAPRLADGLEAFLAANADQVAIERRAFEPGDVVGCWLAVAATDDPTVQQAVFDAAERVGVWVNAADDPDRCSFFLPAVLRREPVVVAVSTQGRSPALAAWLRDRIARLLPEQLGPLAARLSTERADLRSAGVATEGRDWNARIEQLLDELDGGGKVPPPSG